MFITRLTNSLLCHSERSGTTAKNQAIKSNNAAESNPAGAPAGGISAVRKKICPPNECYTSHQSSAIAAL